MRVIQALSRMSKLPDVGMHEIVEGPDGLSHVIVVTSVESKTLRPTITFMCPCSKFPSGTDMNNLEIAQVVTCLECLTKV